MSLTTPEAGEIWYGYVPYEDKPKEGKNRPVMVVLTGESGESVALKITHTKRHWSVETVLDLSHPEAKSYIECNRFLLIPAAAFQYRVFEADWDEVDGVAEMLPQKLRAQWRPYLPAVLEALEGLE